MTTLYEKIVESTIYRESEPAPRVRNPSKPLEVICPGFPRSGTESLAVALRILEYDYTYHVQYAFMQRKAADHSPTSQGWDILFEDPHRMPGWVRLARKKWHGAENGETDLTKADFDALIGHSSALVDAPASCFAAELIAAYPEAKVILNTRRDLDKWHQSAIRNLATGVYDSWFIWYSTFWSAKGYWSWAVFEKYLWLRLFRATDASFGHAIRRNGKWIYREHEAMVRALVPQTHLLEWSVEDGWEPLCKFLGKPVPNEPFPNVNDASGFNLRVQQYFDDTQRSFIRNHVIAIGLLVIGAAAMASRVDRNAFSQWWKLLQNSLYSVRT